MTTEQVEQKALNLYPVRKKLNKKDTGSYDPNLPRRKAFIQGAMYVLETLKHNNNGRISENTDAVQA